MPPGSLMPRPADRPPTTEDVGVKVDEADTLLRMGLWTDLALSPSLAAMMGLQLSLGGAGAPIVIDWGSPDWLEMTHRVWSQGGVPRP